MEYAYSCTTFIPPSQFSTKIIMAQVNKSFICSFSFLFFLCVFRWSDFLFYQ